MAAPNVGASSLWPRVMPFHNQQPYCHFEPCYLFSWNHFIEVGFHSLMIHILFLASSLQMSAAACHSDAISRWAFISISWKSLPPCHCALRHHFSPTRSAPWPSQLYPVNGSSSARLLRYLSKDIISCEHYSAFILKAKYRDGLAAESQLNTYSATILSLSSRNRIFAMPFLDACGVCGATLTWRCERETLRSNICLFHQKYYHFFGIMHFHKNVV